MREILFRGKRVDNGNWVEGYLYVYWNFERKIFQIFVDRTNGIPDSFEVNLDTIGQYTSLKDKNGKRVFEGDVVRAVYNREENIYVVVWDEEELDFKATNGKENYGRNFQYMPCCEEVEIIGNVYDNPELLDVTK